MTAYPRLAALALAATLGLTCALATPALAVSDDPVLRRMDAVLEENARLRDESFKAQRSRDKESARQASEAFAASEDRVEKTRAEALAHVAGVSPAQVEAMRRDGKSWGQAAGELGVHPGFLGIGKAPLYEPVKAKKGKRGKAAQLAQADEAPKKGKKGKKGQAAQADEAPQPAKKGKKAAKAEAAKEAQKEPAKEPGKKKNKKRKSAE